MANWDDSVSIKKQIACAIQANVVMPGRPAKAS